MRWQLSAAQWDVLTAALFPGERGLDAYPPPIEVRSHGRTETERVRIKAAVEVELGELGLLRAGRVEPDLEAALRLLHWPAAWVDSVWLPDASAEQPVRVVVAQAGNRAVCALQHPERPGATLLEAIPAAGLVAAVVGKLPAHPPGRSPAVSVALESAGGRRTESDSPGLLVSVSGGRAGAQRSNTAVTAILEQPHTRAGQIAANARDASGRVRRSDILRWCDNPDGRYQMTVSRQQGDPDRLTVGPADPQRLGDGAQRLLASVRSR
ncbi:MAG: ESX secretion-associated protein EspG [Pseudonocardiaceae bacterium]